MFRILLVLLNLNVFFASAQTSELIWQKCWGSTENDESFGIIADGNNYLIAIHISDSVQGLTNYHGMGDIWIQYSDSLGNILWERCYGGSKGDVPQKILKKSENEFFIYGYTYSSDGDIQSGNNGYTDLWVVKINREGDIIWENTYGCPGIDDPRDMILTPDGGFVMIDRIGTGGGDVTNFYGIGDVWMCKCDSLGNIEWEKTLGNDGLDNCVSMIINSDNNIMMIGAVQKHGGLAECYPDGAWGDVWIVELDLQGNIVAQHCYGGSHYELGYSLIEIDDGYAFTASTYSNDGDVSGLHGLPGGPPIGYNDIWVVKLNAQMEIVWQKCLGGNNWDFTEYITQTSDGGLIIIGCTYSNDGDVSGNHAIPGGESTDIWVVKLTKDGEIEWQQCYGGSGDERMETPFTVLKKSDYNYVIASSTNYGPSYDVECTPTGSNGIDYDAWIFEIKDCSGLYAATPSRPVGPHVVCTSLTPQSTYYVHAAALAQAYEWSVYPAECGTLVQQDTTISIAWAAGWEGDVALRARALNECGPSEWSVTHYAAVHTCIGITELSQSGIAVWPNPANDILNIALPQNMQLPIHITLSDLTGRVLLSQQLTQAQTAINLSKLPQGVFFCHLASKEINVTAKIVKGL